MTKLLPADERDDLVAEHVATTSFVNPRTGVKYEPRQPPAVMDPEGDADSDLGADDAEA